MAIFKDLEEREWVLSVTVRTLKEVRKRVRDATGKPVDLMDVLFGNLAFSILSDTVLFSEILWVMCEGQAKAQGVSHDAFDALLYDETLEAARGAFEEALLDFFPPKEKLPFQNILLRVKEIKTTSLEAQSREMAVQADVIRKGKSEQEIRQTMEKLEAAQRGI